MKLVSANVVDELESLYPFMFDERPREGAEFTPGELLKC